MYIHMKNIYVYIYIFRYICIPPLHAVSDTSGVTVLHSVYSYSKSKGKKPFPMWSTGDV